MLDESFGMPITGCSIYAITLRGLFTHILMSHDSGAGAVPEENIRCLNESAISKESHSVSNEQTSKRLRLDTATFQTFPRM